MLYCMNNSKTILRSRIKLVHLWKSWIHWKSWTLKTRIQLFSYIQLFHKCIAKPDQIKTLVKKLDPREKLDIRKGPSSFFRGSSSAKREARQLEKPFVSLVLSEPSGKARSALQSSAKPGRSEKNGPLHHWYFPNSPASQSFFRTARLRGAFP